MILLSGVNFFSRKSLSNLSPLPKLLLTLGYQGVVYISFP